MSLKNKDNTLDLTLIEEAILSALTLGERYGLEIMDAIALCEQRGTLVSPGGLLGV